MQVGCYGSRVLSSELELADLDARHWTNWWRLLVPPRVLMQPSWALAIQSDGELVKLIVAGTGSIDPPPGFSTASLARYAKTIAVDALIVLERDVIAKLSVEIEGALRFDQDYVEQGLIALRALRRYAGNGIWSEPALLDLLPTPSYEPLQRTFDLLVPDRSALVAYVIDDDRSRVHASIIAVKDGGDIVRAGTHRAIADLVPDAAFARDWKTQQLRLLAAVEQRFAKPSIAVFLERATVMRILTGPSDQLARELNAKHVMIDPAPAWLLGLLGGAAVAAMAGRAASALASMLPQGARDRGRAIAGRAKDALQNSGASPFALLGFDPLELWSRVKHFYRQ